MAFIYAETVGELGPARGSASGYPEGTPAHASAVSWGAIVAGAVAAAALSLILLMLGVGLGLSSVSPWGHYGTSAATFGVSTILWVTLTIGSILGAGIQAGSAVAGGSEMAKSDNETGPMGYFVDSLFRKDSNTAVVATAAPRSEVSRIFMHTGFTGPLPADDIHYVGQLVAPRTGLSQQEAERRVTDTYARLQAKLNEAKDAADKARKASAYAALWLFISLLIGAFVASLAATYGGQQRDA
jgi:hypothetical protein